MSTLNTNPWAVAVSGSPTPARTRLQGSPQQEAFWAGLLDESAGNLLLDARAGTGKSTSCREGMWRLMEQGGSPRIRYCCFNKAIAEEFAAKCPPGVEVGTMHRFGFQALRKATGARIEPEKSYILLDALDGGKSLPRHVRKAVVKLVGAAKNAGISPAEFVEGDARSDLMDREEIEGYGYRQKILAYAGDLLQDSLDCGAMADFDDMLWMPVMLGLSFPKTDYLFIDEAQDLSAIQHGLVGMIAGGGRIVAAGDPYQAIYAFRGADSRSIATLRDQHAMRSYPLTITRRCPRSHVALAARIVPDFEAAPEAPAGRIDHARAGKLLEFASPGDLVLCRANRPLISACLRALAARIPAIVRGRAIGDQLMAILRKIDSASLRTIAEVEAGLREYEAAEVARLSARDGCEPLLEALADRVGCLQAMAAECSTPAELPGRIGELFDDRQDAARITFSSVHRAKGSEAERVHLIDLPWGRMPEGPNRLVEVQQRRNLDYVARTRSLHHLTLVSPE